MIKTNAHSLLVQIDGRDAIPIRAIPYVTGWKLPPDQIAHALAWNEESVFPELRFVLAYHLGTGSPIKVLPKEWDAVAIHIAAHIADLRDKYPNDIQGTGAWRCSAAELLPASAFVWRDEFEAAFLDESPPESGTLPNIRHGEQDFNYSPMELTNVRPMALSAFDNPCNALEEKPESTLPIDGNLDEKEVREHLETDDEKNTSGSVIPGKMPRNSMGKLAVKAAWEIECKKRSRATDREVMDRLQHWANSGTEPGVLFSANMKSRSVNWVTGIGTQKEYSFEACQKSLAAWWKSR